MLPRAECLLPSLSSMPRMLSRASLSQLCPTSANDYHHFIHSLRVHNRHNVQSMPSLSLVSRLSTTPLPQARASPSPGLAYDNLSSHGSLLQVKLKERAHDWLQRRGLADLATLLLLGLLVLDVLCNTIMLVLRREITHRFLVDIFGMSEGKEKIDISKCFTLECQERDDVGDSSLSSCLSIVIYSLVYLNQALGLYGTFQQVPSFVDAFTTLCTLQLIFLVFGVLAMPLLVPVACLRACLLALGLKHSLTLSDRHFHKHEEMRKIENERLALRKKEEDKIKINKKTVHVSVHHPLEETTSGGMIPQTLPHRLVGSAGNSPKHVVVESSRLSSSQSSISEGSLAVPIRALILDAQTRSARIKVQNNLNINRSNSD